MATIDEFVLKNIGLWWRYGISRHCDEWKYIIIGRIFEGEIISIPPSLKISESSFNGSYRNTDEVWWRYGISRSCDECRCNNTPWIDMSLHSDTLSSFRANQSLLLLFDACCVLNWEAANVSYIVFRFIGSRRHNLPQSSEWVIVV